MKTAEDYIYDFWTENIDEEIGSRNWDKLIEGIKDYSTLVAKEALKNASEKMEYEYSDYEETPDFYLILNESNIPKL